MINLKQQYHGKGFFTFELMDAFACFKKYVAEVELELGGKVKQLRDNKGGEYIGADFNKYCMDKGISCQHTTKATPQQNGVTKCLN